MEIDKEDAIRVVNDLEYLLQAQKNLPGMVRSGEAFIAVDAQERIAEFAQHLREFVEGETNAERNK